MSYTYLPLSKNNIKDLTYLYKEVFGNLMTLEMVLKKYDTSYLNTPYFGHLAYYNKKPVAFHGAIPVLMTYNNKQELSAQYGDAMTLPGHTGNGLFTKLGKLTDQQLIDANITFVWGFPNQNSEYGYLNKLNWTYKERMQRYTLKTNIISFEKIAQKTKLFNTIYTKSILNVLKTYKTDKKIKGSVFKDDFVVSTLRNKDYYNYKSFTNNFTINIDGVLFWIKIKNGLLIGDVETPNEAQFHNAFKKLRNIASKCGIGEIHIQTSPKTILTKLMKTYKAPLNSWVVGYKDFSSTFPLEKLKLTLGDLDTF